MSAETAATSVRVDLVLGEAQLAALGQRIAEELAPRLSVEPTGFLDVEGAARFLQCPRSRIYALSAADRIPHHHDGSRLLFDPAELREYVRSGGARRP